MRTVRWADRVRCQQCGQRKPANPDKLWRAMCDEDEREKAKEGVS
jgi:hypothetical protein